MAHFPENIFNTTAAMVVIVNAASEILWVNDAFQRRSGYDPAALKGKGPWPFLTTEQAARFTDMIRQALKPERVEPTAIPIRCLDATTASVLWTTLLLADDHDQRSKAVVVFGMEAVSSEHSILNIETTEERYRLLFENSGIGMLFVADDTTILLVNKEFEKLSGYPKALLEGKMSWMDMVAETESLERMKTFHRLRRVDPHLAPEQYDAKVKRRDGNISDVTVHVTLVPGTSYSLASVLDITERKHREDDINRLADIVRHSSELVNLSDMDGNMVFLNEAGSEMLGIAPDEIEQTHLTEVIPEHLKVLVEKEILPDLMAGKGWEGTLQYLNRKTGALTDVHAQLFTIDDPETGRHKYLANISLDISRRKQAEEIFTNVFRMAPDGISITRQRDGLIIDTNLGFMEISGWERSEVLGRTSLEVNFWADPADRTHLVNELKAGRDVLQREFQYRRKDGTVGSGMYSARTIQLAGETCILFVMQDITRRKETERLLRENDERLRGIATNLPGVVYQFYVKDNGEYGFGYVSERIMEVFGLPFADLGALFPKFVSHVYEDDRERFMVSVRKATQAVTSWNFEGRFVKPSGEMIWFQGMSTPTRHEDGIVFDGILLDITKRKIAEEISRLAEEKFLNIFMMAPDCIAITRLSDGMLIDVNIGFEDITGWKRGEAVGRTSLEIAFWADPAERNRMVEDMKAGPDILQREFQFRRKDGAVRDGIYSARLIRIADENCLMFILNDITERKKTEKALRENEDLLRGITSNMPGVVYRLYVKNDGTYGITFVSERVMDMFGLAAFPETTYQEFLAHVHEEDRGRLRVSIQQATKTGSSWNFEGRYIKPSGEMIWFQGLATPTHQADRVVFDGILLDITERKRVEERSRQAEDKFANIFMMTPDCIVITRIQDGLIMDVNRGFEEITGWERGEVLGRTSLDINVWGEATERDLMVKDLKAGRDVRHRESLFRRKDGTLRSVIYSARPINLSGEVCLIFVLQDFTDQRRLEEERRKLEQQLVHSQKMDAIGQLAGGVAHDFNNILMGIQGNASLLLMECNTDHPHYQKLSNIEEQVRRGAKLTRQLLGFARGGKYEVKTVSINDLIRKSAQLFLETKREIEADFDLQDGLYPVEADEGQIEQVLLNIFINAGHAMPGGGSLLIATANVTLQIAEAEAFEVAPGDYVKISITDTGTGMDQDTLKRIFEPFFTTKTEKDGTGLGLASAYGIVRNHGGVINAASALGAGSTFTIHLPATINKAEAREYTAATKALLAGSGTLLLVDDEPMILRAISEMLKMLGYTVHTAASGQEAVAMYKEKRQTIDLVILDMILPGTSGAQVLKLLQDINPEVKVILASGYALQGEVRTVKEKGCLGFIQKPYQLSELSQMLHQALSGIECVAPKEGGEHP